MKAQQENEMETEWLKYSQDGDKNSGQNPALNRFIGKRLLMKKGKD